jgi:hypothetical protein
VRYRLLSVPVVAVMVVAGHAASSAKAERTTFIFEDSSPVSLWIVVDPANCRIDGPTLAALSTYASRYGVPARMVLLESPHSREDEKLLAQAFDIGIPIVFDSDGASSRMLSDSRMPSDAAVLMRFGRPIAVLSLSQIAGWSNLAQALLDGTSNVSE